MPDKRPGCNCTTLVRLTKQTDFNTLNDLFLAVVKDAVEADEVKLIERGTENGSGEDVLQSAISIQSDNMEIAKLVIRGAKKSLNNHLLQDLIEVYANQYHHLTRGSTDRLTGLLNRRVFDEYMDRLFGFQRNGRQNHVNRVIALVDIDHFKKINDNFGHTYGDEILILIAGMMKDSFRPDDRLFRYGGEEFVLVLNYIELPAARMALERFRQQVENRHFPQVDKVTVSIGFTTVDYETGATKTLTQADRALYYSKNNGRNQIAYFPDLVEKGLLKKLDDFGGDLEIL